MSAILQTLNDLLMTGTISWVGLFILIYVWFLYKIIGEYMKELFFMAFPFKNYRRQIDTLRKENAALKAELIAEIRQREVAQGLADRSCRALRQCGVIIHSKAERIAALRSEMKEMRERPKRRGAV